MRFIVWQYLIVENCLLWDLIPYELVDIFVVHLEITVVTVLLKLGLQQSMVVDPVAVQLLEIVLTVKYAEGDERSG